MAGTSFKSNAKSYLESTLAAADTTMTISFGDLPRFSRASAFYCLLLGAQRYEIIKVTAVSGPALVIERGQEGTSAKAWPRGTLVYQDVTAASLADCEQAEVFRQGAYNPNGALASLYFGEKFYQSDDALWWKSIAAGSTEWRLIAGKIFIDDVDFDPAPGEYGTGQALTMEVLAPGADIYYTDDGEVPDEDSTLYSAPVVMPVGTITYKARAFGAYRWESPSANITTGAYTITEPNWTTVVSNANKANDYIYSMTVYKGELYAVTEGQHLLRYDGDGSGTWTDVCGAPSTGATNGYYVRMVSTADHIYYGNTVCLWRWGTGDGSWTQITTPYANVTGILNYKDTHIVMAMRGAQPPDWSIQSYNIATTGFAQLYGGSYRYIHASQQGHYYYFGSRACLATETSPSVEASYTDGTTWDWIAGAATASPPCGVYCWGNPSNGTPYMTLQNGKIYHYTLMAQAVAAPSGYQYAFDSVYAEVSTTPRVFMVTADFATYRGRLYSWTGSGAWVEEDMSGPADLNTGKYLTRLWPFNGTIYAASDDGMLWKWTGG